MSKLETYTGFNPEAIAEYFQGWDWPVQTISKSEVELVRITRGAALECGDGRFDQLEEREKYGVRIFGGINAIMALHTGGDRVGLQRAKELVKRRFGLTPGTHSAEGEGGCGYADLWMGGQLNSAKYAYQLTEDIDRSGLGTGLWLKTTMGELEGKHFRLNGNHQEEGVRINPFRNHTELANDGLRFRVDDWFMADLGIPDEVRFFKIAESVEKLKKDAAKLEIIVP